MSLDSYKQHYSKYFDLYLYVLSSIPFALLTRTYDFPANWEFPSITLYHLQQGINRQVAHAPAYK